MELATVNFLEQMRQFDFAIAGESLEVYEFKASETLFSCFHVDVTIVSSDTLKLDDYLGKDALFKMIGRKEDRYFHGIVSTFTREEPKGRHKIYKATVVPMLWKLNLISDVRIFQNKTTPQIVKEVLEVSGILSNMVDFREHGNYSPREYCVQFRETNMEFISRLLSEEGMFYFFEYTKEGHTLVIGDMHACHNYINGSKEVGFSPKGQLTDQTECVTVFDYQKKITSGKVTLKDYHFEKPSYLPSSEKNKEQYDNLELYDYPGYLTDADTEVRLADVTLERAALDQSVVDGKSTCRRLTAGHIFKLKDHPNKAFNDEYMITEIEHTGKQPQALKELAESGGNTYGNTFKCISGNTNYRPKALKKPSVMGVQTAMVTGPAGEEIHVDRYGRIKVQFHWDRQGEKNEKTSCWLRVSQPWAGSGWGTVFIPRIGQEVVVSFIDGDPDRPIVTGAVYNGANMPPYSLPDEKTKSTIKTNSTKGGGGFNELRFEDKKGEEEIFIHGEKDWNIEIKNDKGQHVGHDETLAVDNDRSKTVGNDQKESIGNNKDITVAKNHTEDIGEDMRLTVVKNKSQSVGENKSVEVGKTLDERVGEDVLIRIGNNENVEVGKDYSLTISSNSTMDVGGNVNGNVGDNTTVSSGKNISVDAGGTMTAASAKTMTITSSGSNVVIQTGGATITLGQNGDITMDGANVTINASGNINMNGSAINQN